MAREISIGGAVGEGFGLIRDKPLTVLAWGLAQGGFMVLFSAILLAVYAPFIAMAVRQTPGAAPDPAMLQTMMQRQSLIYLFDLVSLMFSAVTYCAVWRAVLKPDQGRFAYLRIGASELYLALMILVASFAFGIGMVVAMIPIAIVAAILVGTHQIAAAVIFGVIAGIAAVCGLVYVMLRVSLVGPMTVDEGQLRVSESWALTRGKVVNLLAVALVLLVVMIALEIVIGLLMVVIGIGGLAAIAGGLRNVPTLFQSLPPMGIVSKLAPLLAALVLLWIPLSGAILAILGAPWARVYLDLKPPRDIASTFT